MALDWTRRRDPDGTTYHRAQTSMGQLVTAPSISYRIERPAAGAAFDIRADGDLIGSEPTLAAAKLRAEAHRREWALSQRGNRRAAALGREE